MNGREVFDAVDATRFLGDDLLHQHQDTSPSALFEGRRLKPLALPENDIKAFAQAVAAVLREYEGELRSYDWEIGEGVLKYVDQELGITAPGGSVFQQTMRLRENISQDAQANWTQRNRLVRLADFVVRRWDALDGNADETIEDYVDRFREIACAPEHVRSHATLFDRAKRQGTLWQFKNIASWSKWLNFVWPEWALIYDARIAFGLNAIHFLQGLETPVFPQPPGRNSLLGNLDAEALAILRRCAVRGEMPPNDAKKAAKWFQQRQFKSAHAYPIYLEVMGRAHELLWAHSDPKPPLVHTEMLLFRVSANQLALEFARAVLGALANRRQL
jgi:hypothetical protein